MNGQDPTRGSARGGRLTSSRSGILGGLFAAVCGTTLALAGPAGAQPTDEEEPGGPKIVLGGRASLDPGELDEGGWTVVADEPDRLVLVSGTARLRVVVDAAVGPTAGSAGTGDLVEDLTDAATSMTARHVTWPGGSFVVFDADTTPDPSACTALPWQTSAADRVTVTGAGDAKVVLGTPCVVERAYIVSDASGNLLAEAQTPRGEDGGKAATATATADALMMTLVPAGADIDDNLSPLAGTPQ
ncbi:hypothetical protein [Promicromonospora sukumoe]|uniref:hypothetical protein n=1 Tax=Promicromonospora sukumoe TaxID=88382 RepID=UPI0036689F40